MKKCTICGMYKELNEFEKSKSCKDGRRNTCKDCRKKSRLKHVKTCPICGETFKTQYTNTIYCSNKCASISKQNRITFNCDFCGKESQLPKKEI